MEMDIAQSQAQLETGSVWFQLRAESLYVRGTDLAQCLNKFRLRWRLVQLRSQLKQGAQISRDGFNSDREKIQLSWSLIQLGLGSLGSGQEAQICVGWVQLIA